MVKLMLKYAYKYDINIENSFEYESWWWIDGCSRCGMSQKKSNENIMLGREKIIKRKTDHIIMLRYMCVKFESIKSGWATSSATLTKSSSSYFARKPFARKLFVSIKFTFDCNKTFFKPNNTSNNVAPDTEYRNCSRSSVQLMSMSFKTFLTEAFLFLFLRIMLCVSRVR